MAVAAAGAEAGKRLAAVATTPDTVPAAPDAGPASAEGTEAESDYKGPLAPDDTLVRRGKDWESPTRLDKQAEAAEKAGLPRGVSVTTPDSNERLARDPEDAVTATRKQLEDAGFPVEHTPTRNDPNHHTAVLPKPVTPADAQRFNETFGRTRGPR